MNQSPGRRITFVISPLGVPVIQQIAIQCLPKPICYLARLIKKKERQTSLPELRYFQLRRRSLRLPQRVIPEGGGNKLFSVGKGFISVGVVGQSALGLLTVVQQWRKAQVIIVVSVILTPRSTVLLEKLTGSQLVRSCPHFIETAGSLRRSQVPTTYPCPEPDQSILMSV